MIRHNGAIINDDDDSYKRMMMEREKSKRLINLEKTVASQEQRINTLESIIKELQNNG